MLTKTASVGITGKKRLIMTKSMQYIQTFESTAHSRFLDSLVTTKT